MRAILLAAFAFASCSASSQVPADRSFEAGARALDGDTVAVDFRLLRAAANVRTPWRLLAVREGCPRSCRKQAPRENRGHQTHAVQHLWAPSRDRDRRRRGSRRNFDPRRPSDPGGPISSRRSSACQAIRGGVLAGEGEQGRGLGRTLDRALELAARRAPTVRAMIVAAQGQGLRRYRFRR